MNHRKKKSVTFLAGLGAGVAMAGIFVALLGASSSGPNVVAPDRYVYYPGTEVLAEGEVRVIACGTGMPD